MIMDLIGIDEKRIEKDGYSVKSMWDIIDEIYFEEKCEKEQQPDGTVLYKGNINSTNLRGDFFYIYAMLTESVDFAKYCTKWIRTFGELGQEDYLAGEREENPLFQKNRG